jgi:hypothetical protein
LEIDAVTDIGLELTSSLEAPSHNGKSVIVPENMSWIEFKQHLADLSTSRFLFRGQKKDWRLVTSFHRNERYRISEFIHKDVKELHRKLSAITSHFFDLNIPDQNGAFFNLLQHHGYPTPLLDWSYSPYVSAFFAFRDIQKSYSGDEKVRIYVFDNKSWQDHYPQMQNIDPPYRHLSVMEFISIDNPRVVPQQGITTVSNIDDIEGYILEREKSDSCTYIRAIDIPASERNQAMDDLKFMGITAGSMFPSIDGICEEQKERNFSK